MRPTLRTEFLPILFVLGCWGLAAWYWPQLPETMPIHWGADGQPDGWMPKAGGAIALPLIATFVYVMMTLSPKIDPRYRNWAAFEGLYPVLKSAVTALMLFVGYLTLSAAASPDPSLPVNRVLVGIGLLFVVLGNYLPKVRSNFFVGIRTPWTLTSDAVWVRTHRLAGKLMVLSGLLLMVGVWLPSGVAIALVIGSAVGLTVVTFGYSYWLYRRLERP